MKSLLIIALSAIILSASSSYSNKCQADFYSYEDAVKEANFNIEYKHPYIAYNYLILGKHSLRNAMIRCKLPDKDNAKLREALKTLERSIDNMRSQGYEFNDLYPE